MARAYLVGYRLYNTHDINSTPRDSILTFEKVSPGVLLWGDVLSKVSRVISSMHGSPAAKKCETRGCDNINDC